jgi:hypothetical protein
MSKRGQVTVFVIIAVLIVAAIVLFFFFRDGISPRERSIDLEQDPEGFLSSSINPELFDVVEKITKQGGVYDPELKLVLDGQVITQLCYTTNFYVPCVNQEPLLIQRIKQEIKNEIKDDIESSLNELESEFERRNWDVRISEGDFSVDLAPKIVTIKIDRTFSANKQENSHIIDGFTIRMSYPVYDLALVAQEIVSQEAEFCSFSYVGFMQLYPDFKIEKFKLGNGDTVYKIIHKPTEKEFNFAVLGCVIPPGY